MQQAAISAHKTLIIRLSSVGDIVLSSLLLRLLRKRFPDSSIDYLVKAAYADLVRYNPNVTRVIEFPSHGDFKTLREQRKRVLAEGYDVIIDIHDNIRSRYITMGAPHVIRSINKRRIARYLLVTLKVNVYTRFGGAPGVALRYLEGLAPLGIADDGKGLDMFFPEEAAQRVRGIIGRDVAGGTRRVIGMCPGAKHKNKMWPQEYFAETAILLADKRDAAVALFGAGKDELALCDEIARTIEKRAPGLPVINLADRLSLAETAAAMDYCSIVVTNDSGLMHIAAARKRKIIAIFGPTVREFGFFPDGTENIVVQNPDLRCRPCTHIGLSYCPKEHFKCMKDIPVARVVQSANRLLAS
jgi:lipopolysaccharide heptosyltransferase II